MPIDNQSSILILTKTPKTAQSWWHFYFSRIKKIGKLFLFALTKAPRFLPFGGPDAVSQSLRRGLDKLQIAYAFNQHVEPVETVCVLSDPGALRWAIKQKETGAIKTLIAGPNVVHNGTSEDNLIQNPAIDRVLVPSPWALSWWSSVTPALQERLCIWPAGTNDQGVISSRQGGVILFVKNYDRSL